jgi:DNA invertase Pin-like site-specific DNA recombinase
MTEVAHGPEIAQVFTDEESLRQFVASRLGDLPRVWAYVRVSSEKQEKEGVSLEGQRAAIITYCKVNKLATPVFVQEVASAAKPLIKISLPDAKGRVEPAGEAEVAPRPLLLLLLSIVREAKTPGLKLIVWKSDRLTRVQAESEFFLRMLNDRGVTLISTQEGEQGMFADADPTRVLMRTILSGFAAYERTMILGRMAMGRKAKQARGGWYAGQAPFGYKNHNHDLTVDPEEAEWVRRVLFLRLHHALSYSAIIDMLVSRYGAPAGSWYPMRVQRICSGRDLYEGFVTTPDGQRIQRPELRITPADWNAWHEADEAARPVTAEG